MPKVIGVDLKRELSSNPPGQLSPVRARLRAQALALIEQEDLVLASYSFNIVPLDAQDGEHFRAGGETLVAPRLLPESGELTALGCGICTLGPRLAARCTQLWQERRGSLAVALDEVATEMIFALGRRIQDRMLAECYRHRLSMGVELHAGDPGLDLSAQQAVYRLADGPAIGVELHRGQLLTPLKSTSVVFAVGRDLPAVSWSRCNSCPSRAKCNYGRQPAPIATRQPLTNQMS